VITRLLGRNACARPTADAHGCNTRENISDVFAVCDQREQPLRLTTKTRAFALSETAPDAVSLTVRERVFEAIEAYVAVHAHAFRGITGTASFWEEEVRILTAAERTFLPVVTDSPHARISL
jgi:hypothetical protein